MAGRTSRTTRRRTPGGPRGGTSRGATHRTRSTSTRGAARGGAAVRRTSTRTASARRRGRRGSLLGIVVTLWMGVANGVGWMVRAVGRQAATAGELDPEHRRDGAALLLLALAILLAVAVWFDGGGPVGDAVATATRRAIGAVSALLPVLLLGGAVRWMRSPAEVEPRGRVLVGWRARLLAA